MPIITLVHGDITELEIQAIVNSANQSLMGGGGVDGAIHAVGGSALTEECRALDGCNKGEAKLTKGHGLPAQYVIHTVGPIFGREDGREVEILKQCYRSSLELAHTTGIRHIAFPAISTGGFHFPKEDGCKIALETVDEYIERYPDAFDQIVFVCYSELDLLIYKSVHETGSFSPGVLLQEQN